MLFGTLCVLTCYLQRICTMGEPPKLFLGRCVFGTLHAFTTWYHGRVCPRVFVILCVSQPRAMWLYFGEIIGEIIDVSSCAGVHVVVRVRIRVRDSSWQIVSLVEEIRS